MSKSAKIAVRSPAPGGTPEQLVFEQRIVTQTGPLPDPQTLKNYEELLPGAADRIFCLAERDQHFIHAFQLRGQKFGFLNRLVGQVFGFLLGVGAFATGLMLAFEGHALTGGAAFFAAAATLIGTAVWASGAKQKQGPAR